MLKKSKLKKQGKATLSSLVLEEIPELSNKFFQQKRNKYIIKHKHINYKRVNKY